VHAQIVRDERNRPVREIAWRSDNNQAADAADIHRHHVLGHRFDEPYAGIEPAGDNVDESILINDLKPDLRIGREKFLNQRQDDKLRAGPRCVDPQCSGRARAKAVHLLQRIADVAQRRLQALQEPLAGIGQRHAAGRPVEQADAKPLLQPADRMADGGGGHARLGGGALKAFMAADGSEDVQVRQVGLGHIVE